MPEMQQSGGVAERSNAPVLKTGVPQGTVGSNPTPSAISQDSTVEAVRMDETMETQTVFRTGPSVDGKNLVDS